MKLWIGYGSEHSANLVIVGTFSDEAEARAAEGLLDAAVQAAMADEAEKKIEAGKVNKDFTERQLELFRSKNLSLGYDYEQLIYEFNSRRIGNRVVVTTDETEIQAFLKILLAHEAKIEIYSAHSHDGEFSRTSFR